MMPFARGSRSRRSLLDKMAAAADEEQQQRVALSAGALDLGDGGGSELIDDSGHHIYIDHDHDDEDIDDEDEMDVMLDNLDEDEEENEGHDDEETGVVVLPPMLDPLYEDVSEKSESEMQALYAALYEEGSAMPDLQEPNVAAPTDGAAAAGSTSHAIGARSAIFAGRQNSYVLSHRRSDASLSMNSAPERTVSASHLFDNPDSAPEDGSDAAAASAAASNTRSQRRVTITGPSHQQQPPPSADLKRSKRRQALRQSRGGSGQSEESRTSFADDGDFTYATGGSGSGSGGVSNRMSVGSSSSKRNRSRIVFASRRSGRRSNNSKATAVSMSQSSVSMDMHDAANRLGSHEANSDWENVAAAAAVVAASSQAPVKRGIVQFSQDDHVLVMLTLLNITNRLDEKDLFTVAPVNVHGYSVGEGKADQHKQGPHSYVLCRVTNVHFDEDERYYTVCRMDTGSEQRADPGWMEPLRDQSGLDAAYLASQRSKRSQLEKAARDTVREGPLVRLHNFVDHGMAWPAKTLQTKIVPRYRLGRARAKTFLAHVLYGDSGYAFKMRFTGINFLVMCSFVYLFEDVFTLAFLPARLDRDAAVVGFVVWLVLGLELLFEFLIRPANYKEIIQSDKAFAPSMARNINRFHLVSETLAILLFLPSLPCVFGKRCGEALLFSNILAAVQAVTGNKKWEPAFGRFVLGLNFLRVFGLVRHWKQMWINNTFEHVTPGDSQLMRRVLLGDREKNSRLLNRGTQKRIEDGVDHPQETADSSQKVVSEEDQRLEKAATIGTALMLVNSHRALFFLLFVITVFPAIYSFGRQNIVAASQVELLQANNILAPSNTTDDCEFLQAAVASWYLSVVTMYDTSLDYYESKDAYLVWAQLLPVRCSWQRSDGVITVCDFANSYQIEACVQWNETARPTLSPEEARAQANAAFLASYLKTRVGGIVEYSNQTILIMSNVDESFGVWGIFNENQAVRLANLLLFILLLTMLLLGLVGLSVMRGDAGRLVLNPLRRMLRIVIQYAENPLSHAPDGRRGKSKRMKSSDSFDDRLSVVSDDSGDEQLGNYETEQLINAIAKIADLLRKCWGVAGAGIISSNLARTKDGKTVVFNPTVPGKRVYALFGFVGINDFSRQLRVLNRDVMILINDVARVVHDEVFRWAHGDSGQCNKNLGSAFLMVFRIGDFAEVASKKKRATAVVFDPQPKRNTKIRHRRTGSQKTQGLMSRTNKLRSSSRQFDLGSDGTLQLASLPGIQSFADRALLGFLKSFAGIHRDNSLLNWKKDFRLGAGVGAYSVDIIYGMDAGWAVEGAVGSEYKIDATYLSPHVNMASRMMSASKQYGVTILLSQAVEELLSRPARSKLRHLDTVYVKGSSVAQQIFTYDARFEGVDFFLLERSPEQADTEAEAYNAAIWEIDQDLRAMRQHVSEAFMSKFKKGVDQYLEGDWKAAIKTLRNADNLMIQTVIEEGYIDFQQEEYDCKVFDHKTGSDEVERFRNEYGDGACKCLIQYMERRNCVPPSDWIGVRHLMSK